MYIIVSFSLLNMRRDELDEKLGRYHLREIRSLTQKSLQGTTEAQMEALEVTLVAMGVAVLLGTIVAVVCIVISRLKFK